MKQETVAYRVEYWVGGDSDPRWSLLYRRAYIDDLDIALRLMDHVSARDDVVCAYLCKCSEGRATHLLQMYNGNERI